MRTENENYKKLVNLLKSSEPVLKNPGEIEREVITRISAIRSFRTRISDTIDFLFGWVYIGWIRKTLIAASFALVLVFIWQQAVIMKRIDFLSRQTIMINRENLQTRQDEIQKLMTEYRNSVKMFSPGTMNISDKKIRELLDTLNQLQIKYKDLENIIESDPELKKMIQKKLLENSRSGINL
jgi:hypothetical protein